MAIHREDECASRRLITTIDTHRRQAAEMTEEKEEWTDEE